MARVASKKVSVKRGPKAAQIAKLIREAMAKCQEALDVTQKLSDDDMEDVEKAGDDVDDKASQGDDKGDDKASQGDDKVDDKASQGDDTKAVDIAGNSGVDIAA
jgi:hypothetical protein